MQWTKASILLICLLVACADLVTTNTILSHGGGEANPFMHLAQTWLGPWWMVPKLGATFLIMWFLSRAKNLWHGTLIVMFMASAPSVICSSSRPCIDSDRVHGIVTHMSNCILQTIFFAAPIYLMLRIWQDRRAAV